MEEFYEEPAYSYAPLPGNDFIRILELKPSLDEEAPLQSRLQIARLGHDDYPYDAMSYTWGEPVFSETLYIDVTPPNQDSAIGGLYPFLRSLWDWSSERLYRIGITPNLSKMLQNMRHPLRTRRLWVDALCINQQDDVEKSHQIPLMFRIYQQASRVVIWLGDSIEDQERMRLLSIFARRRVQHGVPVSTMSRDYLEAAQEAVHRLTDIPWFSRLWVVQEAVINIDVTMYCGDEKMSLVRLFDIVKDMYSLSEHQPARLQSLLEMDNLWNEYARGHVSDISFRLCNGNRPCPTVGIMDKFEHFGCADPRDRVYAISSLQKCMKIAPHYRLSPEQVYLNFASSMRNHGQLQWVLREAAIRQGGERTPGIPSWVPDLRMRPIRRSNFAKRLEIGGEYVGDCINVSASRQKDGNDAICFTNCYWYQSAPHQIIRGVRPCGSLTWHDLWKNECGDSGRQYLTSTRLRFDPWPRVAKWRGDSFPDQPEPAEARAWVKTTLESVWQQFTKRAATVSSSTATQLIWRNCIATVASTLVADGAHIGDLHPSTSKEVQELSDAISDIFKHGNDSSRSDPKGYSQLFTRCLQEIVEETVNQTSMADAFTKLVIITMQGRCFFTSDVDDMGPAVIACGIGPSHMQIGDQALLHYMPFWEQAYLMRACGRTEKQSLSCFELVGDCYLKEPLASAYESNSVGLEFVHFDMEETQRTIILK